MLDIVRSTQFKKDFKLCQKQGKNLNLLKSIINTLAIPEALPEKNKDHKLTNIPYRECHIAPDWLLIYRYENDCLHLLRTGSHADLFKM